MTDWEHKGKYYCPGRQKMNTQNMQQPLSEQEQLLLAIAVLFDVDQTNSEYKNPLEAKVNPLLLKPILM
jgi:hypothetical protein